MVRSRTPQLPPSHEVVEENVSWSIIRNPPPSVLSAAGTLSATDMKLIHHWSTATFNSIFVVRSPETDFILQHWTPDLALRSEYLMYGLLGAAALHIQQMAPDSKQLQKRIYTYRARAIRTYCQALDHIIPDDSYDAAFMMSLIIIILCSQDYLMGDDDTTIVHWLSLFRGLNTIIKMKYDPGVDAATVSPLLCRQVVDLTLTPIIPTVLLNMMRLTDYEDPDYKGLETYCQVLDTLGELYASLAQTGLGDDLYVRTLTFCSHPPDEFAKLAAQKPPRALVILMYYLSFLKLVPGIWWIEGIADRDMSIIARTIDPKWLRFMDVPLRIRKMTDTQEIATLLLQTGSQSS